MRFPYKNTLALFSAEGFSAVATAVTGLVIARLLPVAEFGGFSAAFSFAQIMSVLVDSGMGALVAKNIAKEPSRGIAELNLFFTWRLLMILAASLLSPLLTLIFLPTTHTRWLAVALTPAVALFTMTDFVSWIFKGLQRVKWCLVLLAGSRSLLLGLASAALFAPSPITFLLAAYGISGAAAAVFGVILLSRATHAVRISWLPRSFFAESIPAIYKLGGILILNVILSRMDVMLVARYCGAIEAGLYSGAARFVDGLRMIPTVALGICLPMFAAAHDKPEVLRSRFRTAFLILLALSITFAAAGSGFAEVLFHTVLGEPYIQAGRLFRPLAWSCVLMYSNVLMFALLYALNDHRTPAIAAIAAIATNLALNILSLPQNGAIAASWNRLIAEAVLFIIQSHGIFQMDIITSGEKQPQLNKRAVHFEEGANV